MRPAGAGAPAVAGPRVVVVFDTAGFQRSMPLTGAAARTVRLNQHLVAAGCATTVLLCDLNPQSRPTTAWPLPVRYLSYEQVYRPTDTLAAHVADLAPDVLVMSTTPLVVRYGRPLADAVGAALVYEMHDDEAGVIRSLGGTAEDVDVAARMQAAAVALADGVVAFTDRDADAARQLRARTVHLVPCGVDLGPPPARIGTDTGRVAFVGNLVYEPNARAVHFLRRTLAPALPPGSGIDVFGRYPRAVNAPDEVVRLHGPVPDLRAALATTTVGVAPLDSGGGMKCKVLEYLAAGLPVVATPEALVGLDTPEEFALVSTDPAMADVPDLVTRLLRDQVLRHRLGGHARRHAERYSWPMMAERARDAYAAIYQRAVTDTRPTPVVGRELIELATRPPYWLHEWRTRQTTQAPMTNARIGTGIGTATSTATSMTSDLGTKTRRRTSVVDELSAEIDCARLAAESALNITFDSDALVGFAGRSSVFLAEGAVLKVFTHRAAERLHRELAGLRLCAGMAGARVPVVLGHDDVAGSLAWLCTTYLAGTAATSPEWVGQASTDRVGRLAARLHALPVGNATDLPSYGRNMRDLPTEYPGAYRVGTDLAKAAEAMPKGECMRGFVHGDFSSRNILLTELDPPGVIDFEGCGVGCVYEDLATLYVKEVLLGDRDGAGLLGAYSDELLVLGGPRTGVDVAHLYVHIATYARWVLQWAPATDAAFAAQIIDLAPDILLRLRHSTPS
jgi:aminoglycoside phosphotransferase (APT) family kinase protein/glycosyltransferase involved in cell wall biosynthesis